MLELTNSKGEQHGNGHGPSHLRNEITQDSIGDDKVPGQNHVQAPDSDFVIPETQPEHYEDDDIPLSPNAQALLKRTQVPKAQHAHHLTPVAVTLLSRTDPQGDQAPLPEFSLFRYDITAPKATAKNKVISPQELPGQAAVTTTLEPVTEYAMKDGLEYQPQPEANPPRPKKSSKRNGLKPKSLAKHVQMQQESDVNPRIDHSQAPNEGQLEMDTSIPQLAQPGPGSTGDVKRTGPTARKRKKSRNTSLAQQRDDPWPPRNPQGKRPVGATKPLDNDQPILDVMPHAIDDHAAPSSDHEHMSPFLEERVDVLVTTQNSISVNNDKHMSPSPEDHTELPAAIQYSVPTGSDEDPSSVNREQLISPMARQYSAHDNVGRDIRATPEGQSASPTAMHYPTYDTHNPALDIPKNGATTTGDTQFISRGGQVLPTKDRSIDRALHEVSCRAGPSRVGKPQKKNRNAAAPQRSVRMPMSGNSEYGSGFSMFDHALESLRMAAHAEQVKRQLVHDTEINLSKGTIAALQDSNDLHKDTIQSLRDADVIMRAKVNRQANSVKQLEKIVKGLENDHALVKATVKNYHDEYDKTWKEKIREVEAERASLESDFHTTINCVNKSREAMKETLIDFSHQLELSENKRKDLINNLKFQGTLLEAEKKRCACLEERVMSSLQVIQHHVENNSSVVIDKLGSIQTSVDDTTADKNRDACLKECMDVLHSLRATPFLAAKDTQKAERMLRFVHESIDSKLGALSRSVQEKEFPSEDLQGYIHNQLQKLRVEIIKYDEASAECQKARQTNEHLEKQLESQKEAYWKLEERVGSLLHSEADLKTRSAEMEVELNALRDMTCSHDADPPDVEREVYELHEQLKKTDGDLQVAVDKLSHAEELRQGEESAAATWKKSAEENGAKHAELAKRFKKLRKDMEDLSERYARIDKDYQKKVQDKEATWMNDLHRVTSERDDKQKALQTAGRELDATREALQRAQQQLRSAESEMKSLSKEKTDVESKLKKLQRVAEESSSASTEIANLKSQQKRKDDAVQVKEQELSTLRQDNASLRNEASALQVSIKQLQDQRIENQSTIQDFGREADNQSAENRKMETTLQEMKNQIAELKNQNQDLESTLKGSRSIEALLKNAQAKASSELEGLRREIAGLQTAQQAMKQESERTLTEVDGDRKKANAEFCAEIGDLQNRLMQANAALKASETNTQRIGKEIEQALETYKSVTQKKVQQNQQKMENEYKQKFDQELQRRMEEIREEIVEQNRQNIGPREFSQLQAHQRSSTTITTSTASQDLHGSTPKKKVNRRSATVSTVEGLSGGQENLLLGGLKAAETVQYEDEWSDHFDLADASFANDLGTRERLDMNGVSILEPGLEVVPDVQAEGPLTTFKSFNQHLGPSTCRKRSSTSSLSDPDPQIFSILQGPESKPNCPTRAAESRTPRKNRLPSKPSNIQTPSRPAQVPIQETHSYDRSTSRANTASRMVALPIPRQFPVLDQASQEHVVSSKSSRSHPSSSQRSKKVSLNMTSSPDHAHRPSSKTTAIYGNHVEMIFSSTPGRGDDAPRVLDQKSSRKRKSSAGYTGRNTRSKRHEQPAQSIPSATPRGDQSRDRVVPGVPSHSQEPTHSSSRSSATSSGTQTSRLPRTRSQRNTGRYELSFRRELGK
ncbi:hypothetical protein K505DRAFT_415434 [Melanomma pulvis-pyrius CBS 109.77]|uniref:Uncharacterized protein n=1 Tax=Melanomma pulvis-pyrius CBS 109.77 TaxID=1314802 RepID=A0A6A6XL10_9PLEO|nr:hypothetical protein K505DRAFT_415434 [Melanomma pulvis-pyrius CBS 109.77]